MFSPITDSVNLQNSPYIIDGGFLLHRLIWKKGEILKVILKKYVEYVRKKKFVKLIDQNETLLEVNDVFMSKDAHPDNIAKAGEKF